MHPDEPDAPDEPEALDPRTQALVDKRNRRIENLLADIREAQAEFLEELWGSE